MSKTIELAQHLERLHINNMYKSDFYWTWDKTDEELEAIFTVADALRDLRERNKSTRIFDSGLGISIFRDNSTRTRFSFASACNLLGLRTQDLVTCAALYAAVPGLYQGERKTDDVTEFRQSLTDNDIQ